MGRDISKANIHICLGCCWHMLLCSYEEAPGYRLATEYMNWNGEMWQSLPFPIIPQMMDHFIVIHGNGSLECSYANLFRTKCLWNIYIWICTIEICIHKFVFKYFSFCFSKLYEVQLTLTLSNIVITSVQRQDNREKLRFPLSLI